MPARDPHVLFDLGRVLLHLHYERALALFRASGLAAADGSGLLCRLRDDPALAAFETGHMTARTYYDSFCSQTGFAGSFSSFVRAWNAIFSENRPMIMLLYEWSHLFPLYCLTNTNTLHLEHVRARYPWMRLFKGVAASCELGVMKPDPLFFRKALERFNLPARACLFVDDIEAHVAAARRIGMQAVTYTSPRETISLLMKKAETINL